MTRRPPAPALAALLCVAAGCAPAPEPPPNLLLVTIDTLRADALGVYGYDRPTSPRLDAWAARAARFEAAQATSSWTLPTLATLHTGLLPSTTHTPDFASALPLAFETLAERLRVDGYETAAVASHTFLGVRHGLHQGFTHFDDDLVLFVADSHRAVTSDEVTARGLAFVDRAERARALNDDRPWFLWVHYFDPHDEFLAHAGISEEFGLEAERDLYDGEIAWTDRHLGALLERLDAEGLADDTVVCVVADHGEEWGEHGGLRHGHSLYDELLRVPLLFAGPGVPTGRFETPVSTLDVFPTLLALLGRPVPEGLPGRDLTPLFDGAELDPDRPLVAELDLGHTIDSVRVGDLKLIVDHLEGTVELYDLARDPEERRDLAELRPDDAERLWDLLETELERAAAAGEPFAPDERLSMSPAELDALQALGYGERTGRERNSEPAAGTDRRADGADDAESRQEREE